MSTSTGNIFVTHTHVYISSEIHPLRLYSLDGVRLTVLGTPAPTELTVPD
jgi:hypothetical protein